MGRVPLAVLRGPGFSIKLYLPCCRGSNKVTAAIPHAAFNIKSTRWYHSRDGATPFFEKEKYDLKHLIKLIRKQHRKIYHFIHQLPDKNVLS